MAILIDNLFASVILGHLWADLLNGQLGIILAYLSTPLGLSNAVIGLVITGYMVTQSVAQPVAGYLTDRIGPRWLVSGGLLWMGLFFSLAALIHGPASLVLLVIASLGSGALHPAGSSQVTLLGKVHLQGRETTAASYFFVAGQFGFFFGPLLGGPLLQRFGLPGIMPLILACLPVGAFSGWQLKSALRTHPVQREPGSSRGSLLPRPVVSGWIVAALVGVAAFQSFLSSNISTYIPKYLSDLGQPAGTYGLITALFMAGSGIGMLSGGILGDRFSRRGVITVSLLAASLPVYVIGVTGFSPWLYGMILLAGIFNGAANTSIFVTSQKMFPGSTGLASGLILAFMFSSGAVGTLLCGHLADAVGFPPVFMLTAACLLLGGFLGLALREPVPQLAESSPLQADYGKE